MSRSWRMLAIVGACLAVVLAAMGWMTVRLIQLDRAEGEALTEAAVEESVRLSLWRMDSALAPIVARESARPHFVYEASYPAFRARGLVSAEAVDNETPVPSPLRSEAPPFVLLYFQVGDDGVPTSPQVPGDGSADPVAAARLDELRGWIDTAAVAEALAATGEESLLALRVPEASSTVTRYQPVTVRVAPAPGEAPPPADDAVAAVEPAASDDPPPRQAIPQEQHNPSNLMQVQRAQELVRQGNEVAEQQQAAPAQVAGNRYNRGGWSRDAPLGVAEEPTPAAPDAQQLLNAQEFVARANVGNETVVWQQSAVNTYMPASELVTGFVIPLWIGGQLLLVRQVTVGGATRIQGCWLDWPAMDAWLRAEIADLLPGATLEPVPHDVAEPHGRLLATIPVRLIPGELAPAADPAATPVQATLAVAWLAVVVAVVAALGLMLGVVTLSERRAAFVSAVTHEMRTPLTTFRMYSEMLAGGMVAPDKRDRYLHTLQREADRLGHLVDNVLAYARLEGGRSRTRLGTLDAAEILDHVWPRLRDRAAQAGLALQLEGDPAARAARVRGDLSVVEQILLNLVDNACKYAAGAEDPTLTMAVALDGRRWTVTIRDRGPGIAPAFRRKLFRPFSKSAEEAAGSAPGVGLGLALSRRLARELGGELSLDRAVRGGAAFVLALPRG